VHSYQPEIGKPSICAKLFRTRGKNASTKAPGQSQVNMIQTREREHSRKPDEQYDLVEACTWKTYSYKSSVATE